MLARMITELFNLIADFCLPIAIIFGLAVGSFVSALNYRLPLGEDWVAARSRCTSCNHPLGVFDLLPLLSWLLARGRCRYCHAAIGFEYLAIEIIAASWSVVSFCYISGGIAEKAVIFAGGINLLLMGAIDLRHKILPDGLQIIAAILGIAYVLLADLPLDLAAYGAALGLALGLGLEKGYFAIRKKAGLGMGDVKFFPIAGWCCGIYYFPAFMFLSGLFGVILGLSWKKIKQEDAFPFGPAMFAALIITIWLQRIGYINI